MVYDKNKRDNLFDDEMLDEPSLKKSSISEPNKLTESDKEDSDLEYTTRSEKNKKDAKKKKKKELTAEEILEKEGLKKKQKRNRRILALSLILISIISGFGSYKFLNNKIGATEANKEILYSKFKEAFVDEEHTEIISNLSGKKVDEIDKLYAKIPDGNSKTQFTQWKQVLDEQFKNQENAKQNLASLYEGSNNYVSADVTDEKITETDESIRRKFNHEYQNELLKDFEEIKSQYNVMKDSIKAVNELYVGDTLNELTQAQLDNIKARIEKNPNSQLKEKQLTKFESAVTEWTERNQKREEEQQRLEEEQQKIEEERQQKEIEEARKQAEYEAKLEAEREQARQEAYKKEQEELARQQEEARQKELEEQEKAQKEQEQKTQESLNQSTTPSSTETSTSSTN